MIRMLLLFSSFYFATSLVFAGAVSVGNGGDVLYCPGRYFDSYYSLDYVLAKSELSPKIAITKIHSLEESTQRISKILESKAPALKKSFDDFLFEFQNLNLAKNYFWNAVNYELQDINDERINRFPTNACPALFSYPWGAELIQAVIRTKSVRPESAVIVFHYDLSVFHELRYRFPLQLSFVLVHEWLWNFNSNVRSNRIINYLLHSEEFEKQTPAQVQQELTNLGLLNTATP